MNNDQETDSKDQTPAATSKPSEPSKPAAPKPAAPKQETPKAEETKSSTVFRLYNPNSGDHHYTTDKNE